MQFFVIYLMTNVYHYTYSSSFDTFRIGWLIGICAVLSVSLHYTFNFEGSTASVLVYDTQEARLHVL